MKKIQVSRTAESMAMFRALESARPEPARLLWDPFAAHFLGTKMRLAAMAAEKSSTFHALLVSYIDQRWPGARLSGVARTVFIDSELGTALLSGTSQVVILGAGYDSRAYRIQRMQQVRVFEVDRLATQEIKRERLSRVPGAILRHVSFVETDFLRQDLPAALASAGFDSHLETFFIWEGVTNYLDPDAVDGTLRFVGGCPVGSAIAFTYVDRGLLDGSGRFSVSPNVMRLLQKAGEGWTFGFYPEELAPYLSERGMQLVEDLGAVEYGAWFTGAAEQQTKGYDFYHVAIAKVRTLGGKIAKSK